MNDLSKQLRQDREELYLSQQDAAILLGISRVTFNKWEQYPQTMPLGKYELLVSELTRLRKLKEME